MDRPGTEDVDPDAGALDSRASTGRIVRCRPGDGLCDGHGAGRGDECFQFAGDVGPGRLVHDLGDALFGEGCEAFGEDSGHRQPVDINPSAWRPVLSNWKPREPGNRPCLWSQCPKAHSHSSLRSVWPFPSRTCIGIEVGTDAGPRTHRPAHPRGCTCAAHRSWRLRQKWPLTSTSSVEPGGFEPPTSCMPFIGARFGAVHSCSE